MQHQQHDSSDEVAGGLDYEVLRAGQRTQRALTGQSAYAPSVIQDPRGWQARSKHPFLSQEHLFPDQAHLWLHTPQSRPQCCLLGLSAVSSCLLESAVWVSTPITRPTGVLTPGQLAPRPPIARSSLAASRLPFKMRALSFCASRCACCLLPCFPTTVDPYLSGTISQINPSFPTLSWSWCFIAEINSKAVTLEYSL